MNGLSTFLISSGAMTIASLSIAWYETCKKKKTPLSEKSWRKVKELFCCSLKSGKVMSIEKLFLHKNVFRNVNSNKMFVAFDEDTKKFVTARTHPKLLHVRFTFLDENRAKFEASDMPLLEFNLPDLTLNPMLLIVRFGGENVVTAVDCGSEPSKWLSRYLSGTDSGVRLAMRSPGRRRKIVKRISMSYIEFHTNANSVL